MNPDEADPNSNSKPKRPWKSWSGSWVPRRRKNRESQAIHASLNADPVDDSYEFVERLSSLPRPTSVSTLSAEVTTSTSNSNSSHLLAPSSAGPTSARTERARSLNIRPPPPPRRHKPARSITPRPISKKQIQRPVARRNSTPVNAIPDGETIFEYLVGDSTSTQPKHPESKPSVTTPDPELPNTVPELLKQIEELKIEIQKYAQLCNFEKCIRLQKIQHYAEEKLEEMQKESTASNSEPPQDESKQLQDELQRICIQLDEFALKRKFRECVELKQRRDQIRKRLRQLPQNPPSKVNGTSQQGFDSLQPSPHRLTPVQTAPSPGTSPEDLPFLESSNDDLPPLEGPPKLSMQRKLIPPPPPLEAMPPRFRAPPTPPNKKANNSKFLLPRQMSMKKNKGGHHIRNKSAPNARRWSTLPHMALPSTSGGKNKHKLLSPAYTIPPNFDRPPVSSRISIIMPSKTAPPVPKRPDVPSRPAKPQMLRVKTKPRHARTNSLPEALSADMVRQACSNPNPAVAPRSNPLGRPASATNSTIDLHIPDSDTEMKHQKTPRNDEQIRLRVIEEVISTEADYVRHLDEVVEWFMKPLRERRGNKKNSITEQQERDMFSNIETLLLFHTTFLDCLRKADNICKVFIKHGDFFKLTSEYAKNYNVALETLSSLEGNKRIREIIDDKAQNRRLSSILICPIQRIPRYVILLRELLKRTPDTHEEWKDVQDALKLCEDVANHVNDHKELWEQTLKLRQRHEYNSSFSAAVYRTIFPGQKPSSDGQSFFRPDFKVLHEGKVKRKPFKKTRLCDRELVLGSDLIFWGDDNWTEGDMNLKECEVTYIEDVISGKLSYGFIIENDNKQETFFCDSENSSRHWVEQIDIAKYNLIGIDITDDEEVDMMDLLMMGK